MALPDAEVAMIVDKKFQKVNIEGAILSLLLWIMEEPRSSG